MARKLIAGGLVLSALVAGLAGVSACVIASDHAARVPAVGPQAAPVAAPTDGTAIDLNNWQEARSTMSGTNVVPKPPKP